MKSFENIRKINPDLHFTYGETGFKKGGQFLPHRSHRNGRSVDFMVPVKDDKGKICKFPGSLFNQYGYKIDFDENGNFKKYQIDFEALALHLVELHKEAVRQGYGIDVVIIAKEYIPFLLKTEFGTYIKENIKFYKGNPAVRHDDHYHVNFAVPCEKL